MNHLTTGRNSPPPDSQLSPQEASEKLKAIRDIKMIQNEEIKRFLRKNPYKVELGRYGTPQDKFRLNFYGSTTKEYDVWRMGEKNK